MMKIDKPMTSRKKLIRTVASILGIILAILLFADVLIAHFSVFGWVYKVGEYIYVDRSCVALEQHEFVEIRTLILSHTGQYIYKNWAEHNVSASCILERTLLTWENFNRHFEEGNNARWFAGRSPEQLRRDNRAAWFGYEYFDSADEGRIICVLLQKDGTVIWLIGKETYLGSYNSSESFHFIFGEVMRPYDDKDMYFDELEEYFKRMG